MGKCNISNLSRELKVSRQTIYKKIKELGIQYDNKEFTNANYETLKKELATISEINKSKKSLPVIDNPSVENIILDDSEQSTLRERLKKAKDQYNFNDNLIARFQLEADEHFKSHRKNTMQTHNGTESVIPAITSLEKYVKLNIALSKLISDLETDLDLSLGGDDEDEFFK